jgi:glutamine amidotransferase/cyclase
MGWDSVDVVGSRYQEELAGTFYFTHSFALPVPTETTEGDGWRCVGIAHHNQAFCAVAERCNGLQLATQFHPEKSGGSGLRLLAAWLTVAADAVGASYEQPTLPPLGSLNRLDAGVGDRDPVAKRLVVALDVRSNDDGDLVVTKGHCYDVRERSTDAGADNNVRNMGQPLALAQRYCAEGADELVFLNITSFRSDVSKDTPMLDLVREVSRHVFVPFTVGGGIRDMVDKETGKVTTSAEDVAALYFAAGADKVSLGTAAVTAAIEYHTALSPSPTPSLISRIAAAYGSQAVVVSVDPKRVIVTAKEEAALAGGEREGQGAGEGFVRPPTVTTLRDGRRAYYVCTTRGGRATAPLDVVALAQAVEALGAGELLVNCIDRDGTGSGFEHELLTLLRTHSRLPIVASSGAGTADHFAELLRAEPGVDAVLAAGIFHRREVTIAAAKEAMVGTVGETGVRVRQFQGERERERERR